MVPVDRWMYVADGMRLLRAARGGHEVGARRIGTRRVDPAWGVATRDQECGRASRVLDFR
jgi:hypothetical protein